MIEGTERAIPLFIYYLVDHDGRVDRQLRAGLCGRLHIRATHQRHGSE